MYIGETTGRSVKARFMEHRKLSSVNSEVLKHVNYDHPDHCISLDKVKILEMESFVRGVRKASQIRISNLTLDKDASRYNICCYIVS